MAHSYNDNSFLSEQDRKRKIDAIRRQIEVGAYRVNKAALADALLRSMQGTVATTSVRQKAAA